MPSRSAARSASCSARGEAGAGNMADAYARSTASLGVCVTSTGPAAGNIAGSMVEALTAGTPLLHITGQIETPYLDKGMSYIHEAPDQLTMLKAVSKAAFRVRSVETALGTLKQAVQVALTAPTGPVSVEIPIDIQSALTTMPADLVAAAHRAPPCPRRAALDALAERARRRQAPDAVARRRRAPRRRGGQAPAGAGLRRRHDHAGPRHRARGRSGSLGAYNIQKPVEAFYQTCDAMLVVGSRLRGNETLKYELKLPRPLYRIDADAAAEGRCYATDAFVCGDAALALEGLADRLEALQYKADPALLADLRAAHDQAVAALRDGLGPYAELVRADPGAWPAAASTGCATSPSPTAPGATASCASSNRAPACTPRAAASARACRWPSARPSARRPPARAARPSAWPATAASSSTWANSPRWCRRRPTW